MNPGDNPRCWSFAILAVLYRLARQSATKFSGFLQHNYRGIFSPVSMHVEFQPLFWMALAASGLHELKIVTAREKSNTAKLQVNCLENIYSNAQLHFHCIDFLCLLVSIYSLRVWATLTKKCRRCFGNEMAWCHIIFLADRRMQKSCWFHTAFSHLLSISLISKNKARYVSRFFYCIGFTASST